MSWCVPAGYGFVDFDSPASAQKAVTALKAGGVQAQMAKVRNSLQLMSGRFYLRLDIRFQLNLQQRTNICLVFCLDVCLKWIC